MYKHIYTCIHTTQKKLTFHVTLHVLLKSIASHDKLTPVTLSIAIKYKILIIFPGLNKSF